MLSYTSNSLVKFESKNNKIYFVNESITIDEFAINTRIKEGDNNTLTCYFYSTTFDYIMTFTKDNEVFYLNDNKSKNFSNYFTEKNI
jgi:uncharacterized protein (DUF2344 family)